MSEPTRFNVDRALDALKRDYTLIGRHHIKTWQAWLIVGIFAGAVGATAFIANRSGEVEKGKASGIADVALPSNVELDMPSYYPASLRHPQHIFSGRKLLIKNTVPFKTSSALLSSSGVSTITLKVEQAKEDKRGLSVEIPANLSTGVYQISYTIDGVAKSFPLTIYGLTSQEMQPAQAIRSLTSSSDPAIVYRTRMCDGCYWEMVFAGDPQDSQKLVHNSGNLLTRSTTAGRSWISEYMDAVTAYPRPNMQNSGDPKIVTAKNYEGFYLSSLFADTSSTTRALLGGILSKGAYSGRIDVSIFQDIPVNAPVDQWLFADYEKLAVDSQSSSIYISATTWFEDTQNHGSGIFSSRDAGRTFIKERLGDGYGSAINSMTVGGDTLYAVRPGVGTNDEIFRFRSVQPLGFDVYRLPGGNRSFWPARVSITSNRAWHIYGGPEIVADNSVTSPYRGRLYAVWAQEEKAIADPDFEYPFYGFNFDVFSSYSDNRGETWSQPVKVNDDVGTGDQFFPSVRVGDLGRLHIVFVDHRDNQNAPVFDVSYTYSSNGGMTFSKNIKVTDIPTSNSVHGGRSIGDYLDMVMAYPDRTYVAYPCGQSMNGPTGACMVQIVLPPSPDITANSSDGPITISPSSPLSIAVSLDPGSSVGKPADWWVAAETPFGLYWYTTDQGWVRSDAPVRGYAGPLINLPPTTILSVNASAPSAPSGSPLKAQSLALPRSASGTGIPTGAYTFYFAVDTTLDGILNEPRYLDSVTVNVAP